MAPVDESRFTFLLNPIKDLTKNWEIDLSKFLEEYLCQLSDAPVMFDGGQTVMNFAEAAMLIQGTAGVYSRKVEFLWTLVVQMLDMLANKKSSQAAAKNKDGATNSDTSLAFESVDRFPLCKKRFCEETVAGETVKFLPVTPVCLIDKDKTQRSVPLLSINDDLLGNKDDYRLNFTMCSTTGMLCTEMDIENMLRSGSGCAGFLTHVSSAEDFAFENGVCAEVPCAAQLSDPVVLPDGDGCVSDDGGDVEEGRASPAPDSPPRQDHVDSVPVSRLRRNRLRHLPVASTTTVASAAKAWRPVDIYDDSCSLRARPVRHGRITRPPPCLCQRPTRRTDKRKRKLPESEASESSAAGEEQTESAEVKPPKLLADYLRESVFCELSESSGCRWSSKQLSRVNELMRAEVLARWAECKHTLKQEAEPRTAHNDEKNGAAPVMSDDDDDGGNDDGGGDGSDEGEGPVPGRLVDGPPLAPLGAAAGRRCSVPTGDTYEELVQRRVADYLNAAQQYVQSTDLSRRVARWQEQVRPRLDREMARCQFDIHDYGTQLLHRFPVGHDTSVSAAGSKTSLLFSESMVGEEPQEIARFLLSSLMLANSYNVEIGLDGVCDGADRVSTECQPMDCLQLTLLSRRRHHDVFNQSAQLTRPTDNQQSADLPPSQKGRRRMSKVNSTASDLPPVTATAKSRRVRVSTNATARK